MDAHDQLLLSEGVCSQLGIVEYHDNVWPGRKPETALETSSANVPIVRTFHVRLLEPVTIPANKTIIAPVYISKDKLPANALMLFKGYGHVPEVTTPCTLLNPDNPRIEMSNYRGFTEKIPGDAIVGEVTEVQVIEPVSDEIQTEI